MNKVIKLVMNSDKNIDIFLSEQKKITIPSDDRKITAEDIFKIIEFKPGDEFDITLVNEHQLDEEVLVELEKLFQSIVDKLAKIKTLEIQISDDEVINSNGSH